MRVRPLLQKETEGGWEDIVRVLDKKMVVVLDPGHDAADVLRLNRSREKRYAFDYAFDNTATQEQIYSCTAKTVIDSVLTGYNGLILFCFNNYSHNICLWCNGQWENVHHVGHDGTAWYQFFNSARNV